MPLVSLRLSARVFQRGPRGGVLPLTFRAISACHAAFSVSKACRAASSSACRAADCSASAARRTFHALRFDSHCSALVLKQLRAASSSARCLPVRFSRACTAAAPFGLLGIPFRPAARQDPACLRVAFGLLFVERTHPGLDLGQLLVERFCCARRASAGVSGCPVSTTSSSRRPMLSRSPA